MKAVLYRLPARNVLVLQAADGTIDIEYPGTEVRAHQIGQDAGAPVIEFGRFEELVKLAWKKSK